VLYDDESRFLADPNAARAAADRSLAITRRYAALAPTRENLEFLAIGLLHDAAYYQSKETLATWTSQLAESIEIFHKLAATGLATIDFRAQHAFAHKRMGSLLQPGLAAPQDRRLLPGIQRVARYNVIGVWQSGHGGHAQKDFEVPDASIRIDARALENLC
jgi:hypothetical protein